MKYKIVIHGLTQKQAEYIDSGIINKKFKVVILEDK